MMMTALGLRERKPSRLLPQQVGRQGFQIGQLGTADHIDAGRDKALEEPGEGQARAHQLGVADRDLLLGFGIIEDLQVQVLDELLSGTVYWCGMGKTPFYDESWRRGKMSGWQADGRRQVLLPDAGRLCLDAGRFSPDAGRSLPDAGRLLPDAGRLMPVRGRPRSQHSIFTAAGDNA